MKGLVNGLFHEITPSFLATNYFLVLFVCQRLLLYLRLETVKNFRYSPIIFPTMAKILSCSACKGHHVAALVPPSFLTTRLLETLLHPKDWYRILSHLQMQWDLWYFSTPCIRNKFFRLYFIYLFIYFSMVVGDWTCFWRSFGSSL